MVANATGAYGSAGEYGQLDGESLGLLPAQVRGLQRGFIKRLIRLSSSTLSTLGRVLLKLGYDCTAGPDGKALQFLRELGAYLARCDAAGGLLPVAKHVGTTFQEFYDALNYDLFAQASTTPAAAAEREARRSAEGEEGLAAAVKMKMQMCMAGMDDKTIIAWARSLRSAVAARTAPTASAKTTVSSDAPTSTTGAPLTSPVTSTTMSTDG